MGNLTFAGCRFDFAVETREWCGWTMVEVDGELDAHTSVSLRARLGTIGPGHPLVIDLSEVPFPDASALNVLVEAVGKAGGGEGVLRLVGPVRLSRLLRIAGLEAVLPLHASVEAAIAEKHPAGRPAGKSTHNGPHATLPENQR